MNCLKQQKKNNKVKSDNIIEYQNADFYLIQSQNKIQSQSQTKTRKQKNLTFLTKTNKHIIVVKF